MLDVLEVQDKLKSFSSYQLVQEMQMPTGRIPQFLVLSELNRRKDMKQDMAKRESADQPTVKEEVVAASGMPMANASEMAQQLAPQSSMTENTGIASMMPRELPSEEEPMRMSYGGMLKGSRRIMPRPGLGREVTDMRIDLQNRFPFPAMQGRFSSGLSNLGRDISGRVQNRTQEEVDDFIGEVDNMAQERFEVNLSEPSQRQRDMQSFLSGKGQPDPRTIKTTTAIPFAMNEGGVIKAQNGMFADIASGLGSIDNTSGLNLPSFAGMYNYAKTKLGLSDTDARDMAEKMMKQVEVNAQNAVTTAIDGSSGSLPTMNLKVDEGQQYDTNIYDETYKNLKRLNSLKDSPLIRYSDVKPEDFFRFGSDFVPESQYETLAVKPALMGIQEFLNIPAYGTLLSQKGAEKVAEFFEKLPTDEEGKPITQEEYLLRYVGQPAKDVDAFNKMISDQLKAEDDAKAPAERDFRKEQEKMIYEESMKKSNLLAEEREKEEEKKKKQKAEEDKILGGLGGASSSLSGLSAEIDKLRADREKSRGSEKWFRLAEIGLGMMGSEDPTVLGSLGKSGKKALKGFMGDKKAYDKDMLTYATTKASIEKSKAELGLKGLVAKKQLELAKKKGLTSMTQKERTGLILDIDKELNDIYKLGDYDIENPEVKKRIFQLETQKRMLQLGLPLAPTSIDFKTSNVATS
jgi:hypothetical protein